jgi:hypothetical protein
VDIHFPRNYAQFIGKTTCKSAAASEECAAFSESVHRFEKQAKLTRGLQRHPISIRGLRNNIAFHRQSATGRKIFPAFNLPDVHWQLRFIFMSAIDCL